MSVLLIERADGCAILTLNRPEAKNALSRELRAALATAVRELSADPKTQVLVLTGAGTTFCAGGNLQRLLDNRQKPPEVQAQSIEGLHGWIEAIRTFPKPVIAAVEGAAAGAGFSLALACDFIVAADNAVFVMAYSSVGLSPDGGGTWSLTHALPRQLVSELLMCGERIGSARLQQLGVVNRVTPAGGALAEALALAARLNERAPNAIASIKELVADAATTPLARQLASERDHFVRNLHHANGGIGIQAFLDKQPPRYS